MKRTAYSAIGMVLTFGLLGLCAIAQSPAPASSTSTPSGSSLGDYARQIKKPGTTGKKVFDNDNLPKTDHLSVVGAAQPTDAAPAEDQASSTENKPAEAAKSATTSAVGDDKTASGSSANGSKQGEDDGNKQAAWKQWGEKITAQKDQIDLIARELDVLQREYQIRAAAMYADAGNRMRNSGDWDKQDAQYKQQIADKQKALDDAKAHLDEMQEDARKAGVPASVREP